MKLATSMVVVVLMEVVYFRPGNAQSQDLQQTASEAPTGYDNQTNGFSEQGPPFESLNAANIAALRSFNDNRFIFEEFETIEDGLGPVYNAQSCRECHQNVVTGGASQITEQRAAYDRNGRVVEAAGGSLNSFACDPSGHRRAARSKAGSPDVPHVDEHAGGWVRRKRRRQHAHGDSGRPARRYARHGRACSRT